MTKLQRESKKDYTPSWKIGTLGCFKNDGPDATLSSQILLSRVG